MAPRKVPTRPLGSQGLTTSAQGLGCMGAVAFYVADPAQHHDAMLETFDAAVDAGVTLWDTAFIYAHPTGAHNESLVGEGLRRCGRDAVTLATKFGINTDFSFDSSPPNIRRQLAESLARLGTDHVDLYYQHRVDPATPMETVAGELKQLIKERVVRYWGLSECTADELRAAHAVQPVSAIQAEWSLQTRDAESALFPAARQLGVGIVVSAHARVCGWLLAPAAEA